MTFCSFNLVNTELTVLEAALTAFCFEDFVFSPLYAEECVWCQCNHIWGNYVFRRQRASSGKAIRFPFEFSFWIFEFVSVKESKLIIFRLFEQLLCWSEYYWTVQVCLLSPPAAPGYENLCGHRLRHSAGPPAPQGHHRARTGHWRRHQAIQQVCEASLRAVHWAGHENGWYCRAERWDRRTFGILINQWKYTVNILQLYRSVHAFLFWRWWQHGGHWSDSPACSQPAGRGEGQNTDGTLEGGATMCQKAATYRHKET